MDVSVMLRGIDTHISLRRPEVVGRVTGTMQS
jgi:hypothetical protein